MEWVIPAILVLALLWGAMMYRRLAAARQAAIAAWPVLEAKLRQRHDAIAQLAQALQSLPAKEQKPVQAMIKARNAAVTAELSPEAAGEVENALGQAIQRAFSLVARHPELAADPRLTRMSALMKALEAEIAEAGTSFNRAAFAYNQVCFRGPGALVANVMNLHVMEYFGLDAKERERLDALRG